jgi:hypothetical protein
MGLLLDCKKTMSESFSKKDHTRIQQFFIRQTHIFICLQEYLLFEVHASTIILGGAASDHQSALTILPVILS